MMGSFPGELDLRDLDGKHFQLLSPLPYHTADGHRIDVPSGFVTDFASIPQLLQNILPRNGLWDWAAVVHDFLYSHGYYSRKDADGIFLEAMVAKDVDFLHRYTLYLGVRIGGWKPWNTYRANEVASD